MSEASQEGRAAVTAGNMKSMGKPLWILNWFAFISTKLRIKTRLCEMGTYARIFETFHHRFQWELCVFKEWVLIPIDFQSIIFTPYKMIIYPNPA